MWSEPIDDVSRVEPTSSSRIEACAVSSWRRPHVSIGAWTTHARPGYRVRAREEARGLRIVVDADRGMLRAIQTFAGPAMLGIATSVGIALVTACFDALAAIVVLAVLTTSTVGAATGALPQLRRALAHAYASLRRRPVDVRRGETVLELRPTGRLVRDRAPHPNDPSPHDVLDVLATSVRSVRVVHVKGHGASVVASRSEGAVVSLLDSLEQGDALRVVDALRHALPRARASLTRR